MTHERQYGDHIFTCDSCGEVFTGDDDFTGSWQGAKDEGWSCRKIGEDWVHFCSEECLP